MDTGAKLKCCESLSYPVSGMFNEKRNMCECVSMCVFSLKERQIVDKQMGRRRESDVY